MRTVEKILQDERRYLNYWCRPTEADFSINDLNVELIVALTATHPAVSLGRYNSAELTPYTGQIIHSFEYDFCIPIASDDQLNELLQKRNLSADPLKCLDAIMARVEALSGHLLVWA